MRRAWAWGFLLCAGAAAAAAAPAGTRHTSAKPAAGAWPLELPPVLTSSFGEYRPGRLHAGIDLATGGHTGAPCHAVGDGAVVRMRMSPYGYGKALYIQMDRGPLVVYAHLSRFAPAMAARARAEQMRLRRYTFDITIPPGELRVQRGDVVAWSGDTGIGVPHLHFELRDGDVARNPQTAGFAVPDAQAPLITEVAVAPLDGDSHVEFASTLRAFGPHAVLRAAGNLGFEVRGWDTTEPGEHRQSAYRYELTVDGVTLFRRVHERFDYAHNGLIVLEYDEARLARGERAELLYRRPGNALEGRDAADGTDGVLWAGTARADRKVQATPGLHRIEVTLADVAGHVTRFRAGLRVAPEPRVEAFQAQRDGDLWRFEVRAASAGGTPESLRCAVDVSRDSGRTFVAAPVAAGESGAGERRFTGAVRAAAATIVLRAKVRDAAGAGAISTWTTGAARESDRELQVAWQERWRGGWLEADITSPVVLESAPAFAVVRPDRTELPVAVRQVDLCRYRATAAYDELAGPIAALALQARALDGRRAVERHAAAVRVVRRGEASRLDLDAALVIDIPAGAQLEDAAWRVRGTVPAGLPAELFAAGPAFALEPRGAAFDAPYQVRIRPAAAAAHAGLFATNASGELRFLSAQKSEDGWLVGETRSVGDVAVLADTTAPRIGAAAVVGTRSQRIRFVVTDGGAGMGDGGVEAELDGELAIPEWDPETGAVALDLDRPLARGQHVLHVSATDPLANRSERTFTLRVP